MPSSIAASFCFMWKRLVTSCLQIVSGTVVPERCESGLDLLLDRLRARPGLFSMHFLRRGNNDTDVEGWRPPARSCFSQAAIALWRQGEAASRSLFLPAQNFMTSSKP